MRHRKPGTILRGRIILIVMYVIFILVIGQALYGHIAGTSDHLYKESSSAQTGEIIMLMWGTFLFVAMYLRQNWARYLFIASQVFLLFCAFMVTTMTASAGYSIGLGVLLTLWLLAQILMLLYSQSVRRLMRR